MEADTGDPDHITTASISRARAVTAFCAIPIQPRYEISYHRPVSSSWSFSEIHDELAYPEQDRDQGLRSQAQEGFAGDLHVCDGGLKEV